MFSFLLFYNDFIDKVDKIVVSQLILVFWKLFSSFDILITTFTFYKVFKFEHFKLIFRRIRRVSKNIIQLINFSYKFNYFQNGNSLFN